MAHEPIGPLQRLKEKLCDLPGIGARSADRLAFYILREPRDFAAALAQALLDVKDKVRHCRTCFNLTETDPCPICSDPGRDHGEVWVVEQPKDLLVLEASGLIRGVYHVLLGRVAPLDGVEPEHLTIAQLIERAKSGNVREVVLALNPTLDGDATALHIQNLLSAFSVAVTRPSRGLAVGSQLEYATTGMIDEAIRGRVAVHKPPANSDDRAE